MIISRIEIEGFRGIRDALVFQPGRITVLSGRNGLGKTTIFDAVDWCLFGAAWRLGEEPDAVVNLYAPTLRPRVALHLRGSGGDQVVVRSESGVTLNGENVGDRQLLEGFVTDTDILPSRDVASQLRRLVYLPQADIRGFVAPATDSERVGLLRTLLGVPGAAVVESSIRRLRERLLEKHRALAAEVQGQEQDLRDAEASLPPVVNSRGEASIIHDARQFLGPGLSGGESVSGLLALCQGRLSTLREQRAAIEALIAFTGKVEAMRVDVRSRRVSAEQGVAGMEEERRLLREEHAVLGRQVEATRGRWGEIDGAVREIEREIETVRLALGRHRLVDEARREGREAAASVESLHGRRGERIAQAESARIEAEQRSNAVSELTRVHLDLVARQAMSSESERLHRECGRVEDQVIEASQRESRVSADVSRSRDRVSEQERRLAEAELLYNALLGRLSRKERLTELLVDVARIVGEMPMTECPLCGAPHGAHDVLLRRISERIGAYEQGVEDEVQRARVERGEALGRLREEQSAFATAERELAEVQGRRVGLVDQRTRLRGELDRRPSVEPSEQIGHLLREVDEKVRLAEAERVAAQVALAEAKRELQQIDIAVQAADERRRLALGREQRTLAELGQLAAVGPEDLATRLGQLESRYQEGVREREAVGETRRRLSEEHSRLGGALADLEVRVSASQKQIAESRQTEATIDDDERGLRARAGIEQDTDAAPIRERLLSIVEAIVVAERLCADLEQTIGDARRREIAQVVERLRAGLAGTQGRLEELGRAEIRFREWVAIVEARSASEAASAAVAQEAAIQHCLKTLSPYRHLNRVSITPSVGQILVSDRYLRTSVRPDLYSSTGQMNVLALSVFLGVALRQRITTLGVMLLDEPIQNLDDMHFLAFTSLVKRIGLSRQIVFSTADNNVAEVFRRQIRSTWAKHPGDYVEYQWEGFDHKRGPILKRRAIPDDLGEAEGRSVA